MTAVSRTRVLFVGAFPPRDRQVFGGNVTACRVLMQSSFSKRLELDLLDSTQISNPLPALPIRLLLALRRSLAFVTRIERHRPDAVLMFAAVGASVVEKGAMAWYARLRGIPAVIFPRGGRLIDICQTSRLHRIWTRFAFGGASAVFCQGERWQQFAVDVLGRTVASAPVIPNWTATPDLLALNRERERAAGPVRVLFLGCLEREKGIEELIMACRSLAPRHRFSLTIAGEGYYSQQARELVREMGLENRVVFAGWLDEIAVRATLVRNDILVLPSWSEGLPNVMIEGMAAGLAVVATRVGSIPDYATDGEHAILVEPRDSTDLASALARLMEDPGLRARIARAGREMARRRFNIEDAVDLMVEQFVLLTETTGRSRSLKKSPRIVRSV